ncbi:MULTISPECIES: hypothetical protein [Rhizobium]|uniref:hypothetical protein n=1 Tax=Rhizobium TaxID=379 RepID=UPI00102FAF6F|nr:MULTISPECIES: hypothetical protein [Rhizobium]TAX30745.1 hypothetical protein ELI04_13665 [Rhizobium leguminosarum]TBD43289.1 hypothetical protein ELH19_14205 [Rhizobium ruizarguesonis]
MTDDEYGCLVASHGDAVPPRDRIRLHDYQVPALDSLLRVMREEGIDKEVRVFGVMATACGRTRIDKEFTDIVDPRSAAALCHEITFARFEQRFQDIFEEETTDD